MRFSLLDACGQCGSCFECYHPTALSVSDHNVQIPYLASSINCIMSGGVCWSLRLRDSQRWLRRDHLSSALSSSSLGGTSEAEQKHKTWLRLLKKIKRKIFSYI